LSDRSGTGVPRLTTLRLTTLRLTTLRTYDAFQLPPCPELEALASQLRHLSDTETPARPSTSTESSTGPSTSTQSPTPSIDVSTKSPSKSPARKRLALDDSTTYEEYLHR
jgi:hypothetical protein